MLNLFLAILIKFVNDEHESDSEIKDEIKENNPDLQ